ncbi:MAG: DUF1320 domain-containing protein [Candidatus Kapabacteria bacterium]|nr:DUF1320 domain-containing protein [Candidatus Kapabacteria bacterium]
MYCAKQDILKRMTEAELIRATANGNSNQTAVDDDVLGEAIQRADDDINTALGGRYTVPFAAPVPVAVKNLSVTLTVFYLKVYRYENDETLPEGLKLMKQSADKKLADIAKGTSVLIDIADGTPDAMEQTAAIRTGAMTRSAFTDKRLGTY